MNLNDFGYTKPNKPKFDYCWYYSKIDELDNYYRESNSYNEIIALDENLNTYNMGAFELAVPDQFISAQITLVKLKNTWVSVYYAHDGFIYFFKENKELIYKLDNKEVRTTDFDRERNYYYAKVLSVIKSVLG